MEKFKEIWGDWKEGPSLIGSVVEHLKDKSIVVYGDEANQMFKPAISLPMFKEEISGQMISVNELIPEAYKPVFMHCLGLLFNERMPDIVAATCGVTPVTQEITQNVVATLSMLEAGRKTSNAPDEFWKISADYFGLPELVETVNTEYKKRLH